MAIQPPTTSLQPGDTGTNVKQLQDYLVSLGFLTPAQVATGPGIYGPQTTAAVKALQQSLGVDNSSGPGYYGPRTIQAISTTTTQPTTHPTTQATPTTNTTSTTNNQGGSGNTNGNIALTSTPQVPVAQRSDAFLDAFMASEKTIQQYITDKGISPEDAYVALRDAATYTTGRANALIYLGPIVQANQANRTTQTTTQTNIKPPPTTSLQPGDTGDGVKQLQDYLVSVGLMTQAQVDTGYGTYGPQTTAAVKALQTKLGVDNTSGPGYYGPKTIQATSATTATSNQGGTNTNTNTNTNNPSSGDTELANLLNNPNLSSDQKDLVKQAYDLVATNDKSNADRLIAAFNAATEYSSPYFKAQILVATDALNRALGANAGDLAHTEQQLSNTLNDLTTDINASKDQLDFQHAQELQQLSDSYKTDLENTRTDLASVGKSSSSVRSRAEQLLNTNNSGLVESSNRNFSYKTDALTNKESQGLRDYNQKLAYMTDQNTQNRIDLLRKAETQVGTSNLTSLGYNPSDLLGNIGGDIPRQQVTDALSFSSNAGFVF